MLSQSDKEFFRRAMRESATPIKSDTPDDIVARCPICGDSKYSKNKARLHLYGKFGIPLVNCFNGDCQVQNIPLGKFLQHFYPSLGSEYQRRKFQDNLELKSTLKFDETYDIAADIVASQQSQQSQQKKVVKLVEFDLSKNFIPLHEVAAARQYVQSRGFKYQQEWRWFYSAKDIKINGTLYKTRNSIIIPLYRGSMWYGFYSRCIASKSFATYMPVANAGYKVWNYFAVDCEKPVYIFEGIFDALSAYVSGEKNVIACLGATPSREVLKSLDQPVFCLDNDRVGIDNTIKLIKALNMKASSFIYPSDIECKDFNEILQKNNANAVAIKDLLCNNIAVGATAVIQLTQRL